MRVELHHLVDQLPGDRLAPVLRLIRQDRSAGSQLRAVATLERLQDRMRGTTGVDEQLQELRDGGRG